MSVEGQETLLALPEDSAFIPVEARGLPRKYFRWSDELARFTIDEAFLEAQDPQRTDTFDRQARRVLALDKEDIQFLDLEEFLHKEDFSGLPDLEFRGNSARRSREGRPRSGGPVIGVQN